MSEQHNEPGWQVKEFEGYDYLDDDPDPTLEDEMRQMLRSMVDVLVTDPAERAARYQEIEHAIAKLDEPRL